MYQSAGTVIIDTITITPRTTVTSAMQPLSQKPIGECLVPEKSATTIPFKEFEWVNGRTYIMEIVSSIEAYEQLLLVAFFDALQLMDHYESTSTL